MQKRHIVYNIQGMGLDVLSSPLNTTMAYEIHNMRLTPTKESNALEITTECGTLKITLLEKSEGPNGIRLSQITHARVLGYCTLLKYLVLFVKGDLILDNNDPQNIIGGPDYIYRLEQYGSGYKSKLLFEGNLNFNTYLEIESTSYFENSKIQKVYWIDGVNQPRIINIYANEDDNPSTTDPTFPKIGIGPSIYTEFDFLQEVLTNDIDPITHLIGSSARIKAKKLYTGGNFTSGIIQYAYSLYRNNSQETPLIDITSLLYITHSDRGGAPNELCGCSFLVTILNRNLKNKFDYIRLYSIQRNSLNGTPVAKVVADIPFAEEVSVIDDGNSGYDYDYNQLQYQRMPIYPLTLTHKDNVLFFGDYKIDYNSNNLSKLYDKNILISCDNWAITQDDNHWDSIYGVKVYDPSNTSIYPWLNQLDTESAGVKTFKYGETYKLGVQFQDKYGNWSLPYFIKDVAQTCYPQIDQYGNLHKPIFTCDVNDIYDSLDGFEILNYVRIRPVVSFPTPTERNVLCLGVLNPTVFNITDRYNKTLYSLSSWFYRPFVHTKSYNDVYDGNDTYESLPYGAIIGFNHFDSLNSSKDIGGEILGMYYSDINIPGVLRSYKTFEDQTYIDDISYYKNFFYIDQSVATLNSSDIEFGNIFNSINLDKYDINVVGIIPIAGSIGKYNIISQNPLCLNDVDNYKSYFGGLWSLNTMETRGNNMPYGFYDYPLINQYGINSTQLSGILCAQNCWFDDVSDLTKAKDNTFRYLTHGDPLYWNQDDIQVSYYVYPWNRPYLNNYAGGLDLTYLTLNNVDDIGIFNDSESSKIQSKVLANIRQSIDTEYFDLNALYKLDIDNINFVKQDQNITKLSNTKLYCANINKYYSYNNQYTGTVFRWYLDLTYPTCELINVLSIGGYPIMVLGVDVQLTDIPFYSRTGWDRKRFVDNTNNLAFENRINTSKPFEFFYFDSLPGPKWVLQATPPSPAMAANWADSLISPNGYSNDSICISYKSLPHAVFQLSCNSDNYQLLLPSFEQHINGTLNTSYNIPSYVHTYSYNMPWNDINYDYYSDVIGYALPLLDANDVGINSNNIGTYLLLANVKSQNYDPNDQSTWNSPYFNIYDNVSLTLSNEHNLYLRDWIPAGKAQQFIKTSVGVLNTIAWIEGDTYYQRYDCVKTKPYNDQNYQSIIDILSFMVESNVNLDGRYDENRGIIDYTIISDDNFNLLNDVYNQENNFFTYHIFDPAKFNITEFRNDVIWSSRKIPGDSIDQWTKISPVNKLQLDGNKGFVKALRKFNNNIYCFLDHAISRIRFNDRTAIATEHGEPLQLAFTNYVDGCEYVNNDIGCQYGISCCETENGIFFIDNHIPGIYKLSYNEYGNINVKNISKERFMLRWFEKHGNVNKERVFFDKMVNEILFLNLETNGDGYKDYPHCLVYSCDMNSFQQFINNYGNSRYIITHNNWPICVSNINGSVKLWKLRSYKYSQFLSDTYTPSPYSISFVASPLRSNEGLFLDCIYDNISFKADVFRNENDNFDTTKYQKDESFDYIFAKTVYQSNTEALLFTNQPTHSITNLRKKFGSWFARIPRFPLPLSLSVYGRYNRDRMRGNYILLTLEKTSPNINDKMILKELSVDCFY